MRIYRYSLLDSTGKVSRGVVSLPFDDVSAAIRYLERRGDVALSVNTVNPLVGAILRARSSMTKVKRKELAEVLNNLSMLLAAGVPVLTAMNDVMLDQKNPLLVQTLRFICTDIESGQTFGEALDRHPQVFSTLIRQMCRIGEETGRLDDMLKRSSLHLLHIEQIVSATKRALLYPIFLLVVVLAATIFWFVFVVPQLVVLFEDMQVELPALTRLLLVISDFMQNSAWKVGLAIVAIVIISRMLRKRFRPYKYATDNLSLKTPVLKDILETSMIARISEYLGILQSAGVGVVRALDIIIDSTSHEVYIRRMEETREGIKSGRTLSASLREAKAMHPFAIRMIAVGEQTGRLEEQTEYIATTYRERLDGLVEVLGKSLEPTLLILLGGMFALIIGGLLLPIYDLVTKLS